MNRATLMMGAWIMCAVLWMNQILRSCIDYSVEVFGNNYECDSAAIPFPARLAFRFPNNRPFGRTVVILKIKILVTKQLFQVIIRIELQEYLNLVKNLVSIPLQQIFITRLYLI